MLGVFDAPWNRSVENCVEAVSMEPDTFGIHTESIRELAIAAICEAQRGAGAQSDAQTEAPQVLQQGSGSSAPPCCTSLVRACEGSLLASEAGKAPSCSMVVRPAASSSTIMSVNLQCENDEAASLAVQLVDITTNIFLINDRYGVVLATLEFRATRLTCMCAAGLPGALLRFLVINCHVICCDRKMKDDVTPYLR